MEKHTDGKALKNMFSGMFEKKNLLFTLGLLGILLIFVSDWLFSSSTQKKTEDVVPATSVQAEFDAYTSALEKRLCEMLTSVQGAGKVQVMLTLETSGESVYATDEKSDTESGGENTVRKSSYQSEHIIIDAGQNGKQPLVETQLAPEIKGVAIVCEGGDDITVIKRITDLVSVVLGLSTNRICVTKMI